MAGKLLVSQVNNAKLNYGGIGFSIHSGDDQAKYKVVIPVTASPEKVFINSIDATFRVSKVYSYNEGLLPKYVVSVTQDLNSNNVEANGIVYLSNFIFLLRQESTRLHFPHLCIMSCFC